MSVYCLCLVTKGVHELNYMRVMQFLHYRDLSAEGVKHELVGEERHVHNYI